VTPEVSTALAHLLNALAGCTVTLTAFICLAAMFGGSEPKQFEVEVTLKDERGKGEE